MSSKYETVETNKVKITFTIPADKFRESVDAAYKKNRGKINIPGFRKGRAPRKIIELNFGKDVFYEDAVNIALPDIYEQAVSELKLEVVSRPEIDIIEIGEETGVSLEALVYTKPVLLINADEYIGIGYDPVSEEVTDEDVNAVIDSAREKNSRMISVERPIENEDTAVIDFEGFVDGAAFDGGKGSDYELVIGSNSFVDTFEEQLIGLKSGESKDVNVTFPQDYRAEELAGKPALFKVTVKDIRKKELPEADDDFAQDVSDFDSLEEYKADIRNKLAESKKEDAKRKKEDAVVRAIVDKLNFDIPEAMIENQIDQMVNDFGNQLRMQGLPLDRYLEYMGQDMESLRKMYRPGAESQVKGRLVLESIANNGGFTVSEEEMEEEMKRLSEAYGMELERLKEIMRDEDKQGLEMDIKVKKSLDLIAEKAVPNS